MKPYELLHYETEDFEIDVWAYPVVNLARIYLNKSEFDTIHLKQKNEISPLIEYPTLGRWHL